MTTLLIIKELVVKLQDKTVLSSLDLTLQKGEILGLVGASGCGKTTLLNTIAGFNKVAAGTINIETSLLSDANNIIPADKRQVGMIFQDYALFPHLTVRQNIAFGITQLPSLEQQQKVDQLLAILKLDGYADSFIHQLSGGQQQRVAIARALAPQPKLLLLDEPFSNIDARLRNELMLEIRGLLKQFNTTAIFVTHNKDEVFTFADKMAVMAQGKLLQYDSPTNICRQPSNYQVADFLQLGSWLPCIIKQDKAQSLLGDFILENGTEYTPGVMSMLVKPSQMIVQENVSEKCLANAQVVYISVTEQGFHYYLSSVSDSNDEKDLHFSRLSVYSDVPLSLKQKVFVSVLPHQYLFYQKTR